MIQANPFDENPQRGEAKINLSPFFLRFFPFFQQRRQAERQAYMAEQEVARYRWLRDRNLETINQGGVFAGITPENMILNGVDLDAAVDAAIEAAPNPTKQ